MREIPPPLELECLKALWTLGEGSVKDVRLALTRDRRLAYTTVLTILDRLAKKRRVERRKAGRFFVYSPLLSRDELRRLAVRDLVDSFFDGSEERLIAYLEGRQPAGRPAAEPEPLDTALL
jgi:predicted transcriptional regulator